MNNKNSKNNGSQREPGGWWLILETLLSSAISNIGDKVALKVDALKKSAKRTIVGSLLAFVGSVFFLVGVSLLINFLLGDRWPWAGYGTVGLVAVLAGYLILKKSN